MLLKFDKARGALVESLRRVEDIVPQSIGCQVNFFPVHFCILGLSKNSLIDVMGS